MTLAASSHGCENAASPQPVRLPRRLAAEALGTALLLAIVIGSGIMGERLAGGNVAIALLGNTLATGAGLAVLVTMFGPLSGAHFNPAVTLVFAVRQEIGAPVALAYIAVQLSGAIVGVWVAHLMFGEAMLQVSAITLRGHANLIRFVARASTPCGSITSNPATLAVCLADYNCDHYVNGNDFDEFAGMFEIGDHSADLNADGYVNANDYDAFASAFEAGC